MENGTAFQPNGRYRLGNEKFRLYYTLASTETQTITVVMGDNFGKSYEMKFSFNDTDDDEEEKFTKSTNNSVVYPYIAVLFCVLLQYLLKGLSARL